jgi:glycosyltransferase involved in cell wall biosynthesis
MKRVLIMDLFAGGHHARYIRWILECDACREAGVVLAGRGELFDHAELKDIAGSFKSHYVQLSARQERIVGNCSSTIEVVRRQFTVWKIWRETYDKVSRAAQVDMVVLPYTDDCLEAIALRGSPFGATPWTGIAMNKKFHFPHVGVTAPRQRFSAVREWLFRCALRDRFLTGLFTVDPTLCEYAGSRLSERERQKLAFLPDPAIDHVLPPCAGARESLGIPQDAKVVLVYGKLTERKGIRLLIECASSSQCRPNIYVLLAGEQSPGVVEFLAGEASSFLKRQNRLKIIDGYVSDLDEARLFAVADCMWVAYPDFYTMSGVLVLAARHGIPCLVSDSGLVGYLARKQQFGLIVNPDDRATVFAALQQVSSEAEVLAVKGRRAMTAFSRHSIFEFQKAIGAMIETAPVSSLALRGSRIA